MSERPSNRRLQPTTADAIMPDAAAETRSLTAVAPTQDSGYNLARMAFEIVLAPEAVTALKNLTVPVRTGITEALELHLTHEPTKVSKSRIKRLRGLTQPQYRLRVGDIRVFYDVTETQVQVLAIVTKAEAQRWLETQGTLAEPPDQGPSGGSQG
jgi:mRNA interferase RelE/StbE